MKRVRTRIAPSPTGFPHIGTIFQALINYALAKQNQGKFIVRIEDTDQARKVDGAEEEILSLLKYYDLDPDESPLNPGNHGPYRQSERLDIYQKYANQLLKTGHAYYCFCSKDRLDKVRKNMQKVGQPPMYDQHCRNLDPAEAKSKATSETHVIRMKVPESETIVVRDEIRGDITFESHIIDDQVIVKSDGFPTYHLAVVIDDHLMEITHIVRGEEWISSAPKHCLLYRYFGWDMPKLIHTPLLRNPDKSKLSKRHGHTSATWYKKQGYLTEAVLNFLASRVWNHPEDKEIYRLDEIIKYFSIKNMHIQGPIVDLDKLNWINGQWIRSMSDADLITKLSDYKSAKLSNELLAQVLPLIKERLVILSEIDELTHYFHTAPQVSSEDITKQSKLSPTETADYVDKVIDTLNKLESWTADSLEKDLRHLQQSLEMKPKSAFMTIRMALTGNKFTPPLFDVIQILGKKEAIKRLTIVQSTVLSS